MLLKKFLEVFQKDRLKGLNCLLIICFLVLFPSSDFYSGLELELKKPVVAAEKAALVPPSFYPVNFTERQPDWLSSRSVLVIEPESRSILFQKNPDLRLMPASTTKMMTALVTLENYSLDQVLRTDSPFLLGRVMRLVPQEQITVRNLLYGLLVASANDSAELLAENFPGGRRAFIARMNEKAAELHLYDTHFVNPTGVEEWRHYSTVHDLVILAAEAFKNQTFQEMVGTRAITVSDVTGMISHPLENINELLGEVRGLKGIKTGWTEHSGECLISFVERDGHKIMTAVLGSGDRFGETRSLIKWAFANHQWQPLQNLQTTRP